ncbi:MAG: glycosyltransferase, partial [Desulfovibrio sp.]|nr:glycosyltransferase [Desulfovibrio sp.]
MTSMSLQDKARLSLKKAWKGLPPAARELPLKLLCLLRMGRRRHVPAAADLPVYIIGNFQAGGGISRSAQLYAGQIREKHRHCICVDSTREMLHTVKSPISDGSVRSLADIRGDTGSGTVIIHLNPPQFLFLLCRLGGKYFQRKHVVAYWAWELEDLPALWKFALRFVDAAEVPSTFTQVAVARNTDKPVTVCPHVVPEPCEVKQTFARDGKLRCLFVFDIGSSVPRKNPQSAIKAFVRAFRPEEAELTIKVIQANDGTAWHELQRLVSPHPHVHLVDGWLDDAALDRLFLEHDLYLSLHRSEGYGLTIREAMLRGLYVVATGWSGNMDFMEGERIFAVPYTLIPVNMADMPFGKVPHARWAEPDIRTTVEILRNIKEEHRKTRQDPQFLVSHESDKLCMNADPSHILRERSTVVVIVAYDNDDDTLACLAALAGLRRLPGHICLVDNSEQAGMSLFLAWQQLWKTKGLPSPVRMDAAGSVSAFLYLPLPDNRGFAAGVNAAVALLSRQNDLAYLWLLNPDTLPDPQALEALLDVAESDPNIGVVGSTLVLPTEPPTLQAAGGSGFNPFWGTSSQLLAGYSLESAMNHDENAINHQLKDIIGASMLVRAEVFQQAGPLDESYFLYGEETEWCLRIRAAGYRLAWASKSHVMHKEGGSSGARPMSRPAYVDYLMLRNRLLLLKRHYPASVPLAVLSYTMVALKRVQRGQTQRIPLVWRALRDGLSGKAGKPDIAS